jgi:hypothetical protein
MLKREPLSQFSILINCNFVWFVILLEGNLLKPSNPYCGPTDRRPTVRLTAEELKYSRDTAQWCRHPTNNMFEVGQNSAPFGGRPIGGAVEALLTKVVNRRASVMLIVYFFVAAAVSVITRPNGAESIILLSFVVPSSLVPLPWPSRPCRPCCPRPRPSLPSPFPPPPPLRPHPYALFCPCPRLPSPLLLPATKTVVAVDRHLFVCGDGGHRWRQ